MKPLYRNDPTIRRSLFVIVVAIMCASNEEEQDEAQVYPISDRQLAFYKPFTEYLGLEDYHTRQHIKESEFEIATEKLNNFLQFCNTETDFDNRNDYYIGHTYFKIENVERLYNLTTIVEEDYENHCVTELGQFTEGSTECYPSQSGDKVIYLVTKFQEDYANGLFTKEQLIEVFHPDPLIMLIKDLYESIYDKTLTYTQFDYTLSEILNFYSDIDPIRQEFATKLAMHSPSLLNIRDLLGNFASNAFSILPESYKSTIRDIADTSSKFETTKLFYQSLLDEINAQNIDRITELLFNSSDNREFIINYSFRKLFELARRQITSYDLTLTFQQNCYDRLTALPSLFKALLDMEFESVIYFAKLIEDEIVSRQQNVVLIFDNDSFIENIQIFISEILDSIETKTQDSALYDIIYPEIPQIYKDLHLNYTKIASYCGVVAAEKPITKYILRYIRLINRQISILQDFLNELLPTLENIIDSESSLGLIGNSFQRLRATDQSLARLSLAPDTEIMLYFVQLIQFSLSNDEVSSIQSIDEISDLNRSRESIVKIFLARQISIKHSQINDSFASECLQSLLNLENTVRDKFQTTLFDVLMLKTDFLRSISYPNEPDSTDSSSVIAIVDHINTKIGTGEYELNFIQSHQEIIDTSEIVNKLLDLIPDGNIKQQDLLVEHPNQRYLTVRLAKILENQIISLFGQGIPKNHSLLSFAYLETLIERHFEGHLSVSKSALQNDMKYEWIVEFLKKSIDIIEDSGKISDFQLIIEDANMRRDLIHYKLYIAASSNLTMYESLNETMKEELYVKSLDIIESIKINLGNSEILIVPELIDIKYWQTLIHEIDDETIRKTQPENPDADSEYQRIVEILDSIKVTLSSFDRLKHLQILNSQLTTYSTSISEFLELVGYDGSMNDLEYDPKELFHQIDLMGNISDNIEDYVKIYRPNLEDISGEYLHRMANLMQSYDQEAFIGEIIEKKYLAIRQILLEID
ncbi:MAG: hypothetical protein MHMPM18_002458, partial [Marteilia pararefringens]